jgi:Tol biopolymer transport system component
MNSDGSGQTRLTRTVDPAWDGFPAFSPDGRRIAYTCGNWEICVMNANGSDPVRVTSNPWPSHAVMDEVPTWSPDGTRIAFDRLVNGRDDLYVVNVDGSGLHQLTHGVFDEDASWSPDGSQIAFDGIDRNGLSQIFVVNADGSGRRELTHGPGAGGQKPAWSPAGERIAYRRASPPFGADHIWVVNADGTGAHSLTRGPWNQADPSWSPDGQMIAYDSNEGYRVNIWTMNVDGTAQTQITHSGMGGYNITPSWQPVLSPPPTAPVPAAATLPPSRPTPEARLAGVFVRAVNVLYFDLTALSSIDPFQVLAIGDHLINDAVTCRRRTLELAPRTNWGKRFKRASLAMCASARVTGKEFNAAVADALKGHKARARHDQNVGSRDLARMFIQEGRLIARL